MSNNTLTTGYQKLGANVWGMSTSEALESAQMTGWNQRLVEPIVMDGITEVPTDWRFNIADVCITSAATRGDRSWRSTSIGRKRRCSGGNRARRRRSA